MTALILRPNFAANRAKTITLEQPAEVIRLRRPEEAYALYVEGNSIDEAEPEKAMRLYRKAIELDPELDLAYTNLGNLHYRKGQQGIAMQLYERALELRPTQPEAHYNIGYVLLQQGQASESVEHFLAAITERPEFEDAHFNLAVALEQLGKAKLAKQHWKKYLELEPHGEWADVAREHLSGQVRRPRYRKR